MKLSKLALLLWVVVPAAAGLAVDHATPGFQGQRAIVDNGSDFDQACRSFFNQDAQSFQKMPVPEDETVKNRAYIRFDSRVGHGLWVFFDEDKNLHTLGLGSVLTGAQLGGEEQGFDPNQRYRYTTSDEGTFWQQVDDDDTPLLVRSMEWDAAQQGWIAISEQNVDADGEFVTTAAPQFVDQAPVFVEDED